MLHRDLAHALRAWRDRLGPSDAAGTTQRRRAPGLRREEVAARAAVSVSYLTRLEQGRARAPSLAVIRALGVALALDADEIAQLHRLAGYAEPAVRGGAPASGALPAAVPRILDHLAGTAAIVGDAEWTIVAATPLAEALLGGPVVGENAVRRQFHGPPWVAREPAETEKFEYDLVGDLHRQVARRPDDERLRTLIEELRASSPRFAALWAQRPSGFAATSRKTFLHPEVGRIDVVCDLLEIAGCDLRVVVWGAPPGTADADSLLRLSRRTADCSLRAAEPSQPGVGLADDGQGLDVVSEGHLAH